MLTSFHPRTYSQRCILLAAGSEPQLAHKLVTDERARANTRVLTTCSIGSHVQKSAEAPFGTDIATPELPPENDEHSDHHGLPTTAQTCQSSHFADGCMHLSCWWCARQHARQSGHIPFQRPLFSFPHARPLGHQTCEKALPSPAFACITGARKFSSRDSRFHHSLDSAGWATSRWKSHRSLDATKSPTP